MASCVISQIPIILGILPIKLTTIQPHLCKTQFSLKNLMCKTFFDRENYEFSRQIHYCQNKFVENSLMYTVKKVLAHGIGQRKFGRVKRDYSFPLLDN